MQCPESGRGGAGGEGGGRGRWGKREREEQRDELERQRKAAFARRDKAIKDNYAKWGCMVLKEDESWEGETREQAERWAEEVRWELLGKGEQYRTEPEGLGGEEAEIAIVREQVTLMRQIRAAVREAAEEGAVSSTRETKVEEWERGVGVTKGTFKKQKKRGEERTLEEWQEVLAEEIGKGVGVSKGEGRQRRVVKDVPGATEAVEAWGREMKEARGRAEERAGEKRGSEGNGSSNLSGRHRRELAQMKEDNPEMKYCRADKGGAMVYASVVFLIRQALLHVSDRAAYQELHRFVELLGRRGEECRFFAGAVETDGTRRKWRWALDRMPRGGAGEWGTEEQIIDSLFERMEDFVRNELGGLPEEIKDELVMVETEHGAEGGSSKRPSAAREQVQLTLMEVIVKLHKEKLASRPVGRAFASQMRGLETLLGRTLVSVLREGEEQRVQRSGGRRGKIILEDSRELVQELERMNQRFKAEVVKEQVAEAEARQEGHDAPEADERVLVMVTYDVESMYPSMKHAWLVRAIDGIMAEREADRSSGTEEQKRGARQLREMVVKLLIFLLQHQVVRTRQEDSEEMTCWHQHEGIGIGQGSSGAIANMSLWGGERGVLEELEELGYVIELYKRYIDDGKLVAIAKNLTEAKALGERLAGLLEGIDREGGSIRIPKKDIKVAMMAWRERGGGSIWVTG